MKEIIVQLQGGLGNQLFQISFASNLAEKIGGIVKIDTSSFIFDYNFKRKFELKQFNYLKTSFHEIIFLYLFRLLNKILKLKKINQIASYAFIHDNNKKYEKIFYNFNYKNIKKIFVVGFFQSTKYIIKKKYLRKIFLGIKIRKQVKNFTNKIKKKDVFVGIRCFEEVKNLQNNFGGIETANFYNKNILKLQKQNISRNFYMMSTKKTEELNNIIKPKKTIIINDIFNDLSNYEKLFIITNFNNYILSNSTFYFWGYYLASLGKKNIKITISKKFVNKDILN